MKQLDSIQAEANNVVPKDDSLVEKMQEQLEQIVDDAVDEH
jgi:hypothetical protein